MVGFILKRKNLLLLFGVGFLIGILLEIALIENGKLSALYSNLLAISDGEARSPRVACIVLVKQEGSTENLVAAQRTWLTKCDEYIAVRVKRNGTRSGARRFDGGGTPLRTGAGEEDEESECDGSRVLNVTARSAWSGLCRVLRMLRSSRCDWFVLAPDNLFVLVDNLKEFAGGLDSGGQHYLGHAISHYEADYNVLSAGVVISGATLSKLTAKFESAEKCDISGRYWRNEDLHLGKYLKSMGILPKDTRDEDGRGRFHGYNINVLFSPGKLFQQSDYMKKALYPVPSGVNCCSPHLITIDAINSHRMYHHYYYIYEVKGGGGKATEASDRVKADGFDWREFLRGEGYNETAIESMSAEEYYQVWARKMPPEALYEMMRKEFGS